MVCSQSFFGSFLALCLFVATVIMYICVVVLALFQSFYTSFIVGLIFSVVVVVTSLWFISLFVDTLDLFVLILCLCSDIILQFLCVSLFPLFCVPVVNLHLYVVFLSISVLVLPLFCCLVASLQSFYVFVAGSSLFVVV